MDACDKHPKKECIEKRFPETADREPRTRAVEPPMYYVHPTSSVTKEAAFLYITCYGPTDTKTRGFLLVFDSMSVELEGCKRAQKDEFFND